MSKVVPLVVQSHQARWSSCVKCEIGTMACKHVLYRGEVPCKFLFIGEGPGKSEDATGIPFVGVSGQLLNWWLEECKVRSYAVTNVVACRPTDKRGGANRSPSWKEIQNCRPRLTEFIEKIARPRALVLVGRTARDCVSFQEVPRLELDHPAYVLRSGGKGSLVDSRNVKKLSEFVAEVRRLYAD